MVTSVHNCLQNLKYVNFGRHFGKNQRNRYKELFQAKKSSGFVISTKNGPRKVDAYFDC